MVFGSASKQKQAFHCEQDVAVRADAASEDKFWLGQVVRVMKKGVVLRWYTKKSGGRYKLIESQDTVNNEAVLDVDIQWTKKRQLTKQTLKSIDKKL